MKARPFLLVVIILAVSGVGYIILSPKPTPKINAAVEKVLSSQAVAPLIGKAPTLSLKKLDSGEISLADIYGQKALILDFWASWCDNCKKDMPVLDSLYKKYRDQVEVIAVNFRDDETQAKDFINSQKFSFLSADDSNGKAANEFGVIYTNTHVLIDKAGNIVKTLVGDIKESDFQLLTGENL